MIIISLEIRQKMTAWYSGFNVCNIRGISYLSIQSWIAKFIQFFCCDWFLTGSVADSTVTYYNKCMRTSIKSTWDLLNCRGLWLTLLFLQCVCAWLVNNNRDINIVKGLWISLNNISILLTYAIITPYLWWTITCRSLETLLILLTWLV